MTQRIKIGINRDIEDDFMDFSRQSQQARIDNVQFALENVKEYGRKVRIRDYMPGRVTYCLGDYPEKVLNMPTEYDEKLIKSMAERGVELIQVHEEWNDAMGYHGGDKYHPLDPEGLHKLVDLCHDNGIKIIPYVSSGYLNPNDKYYKPEFSHTDARDNGCFLQYRKGSADSAAWREFILPMTFHIMDIRKSPVIKSGLTEDTIVTMFINEKTYMVVSSIGDNSISVELSEPWLDRESGEKVKTVNLNGKDIIFLERI